MFCFIFCCITVLQTALARQPLRFKDGSFKIAQFTDLHYGEDEFTPWGPIQDRNSDHVMHSVLNSEHPDFVLFTGDSLTGNNIASNATSYWKYVLSPCLQQNTPWAHVFGNHDDLSEEQGDRRTLLRYDMGFNLSYSVMGPRQLPGVTNYFIPIYGEKSDEVKAVIYTLDTGGGRIPEQVTPPQLAWLKAEYLGNVASYGHVPSILTFHIPPSQFEEIYKQGSCSGSLNNTIEPLPSDGLVELIQSFPDIYLITTGHYHENDFCCLNNQKLFCQGRHSGYGGYSNVARGSRIIQLREDRLETWIRMENRDVIHHLSLKYNNKIEW